MDYYFPGPGRTLGPYSFCSCIEIKNNKARHNLSNVKYRQMAFQSVDGAVVRTFLEPLGQTKVMHSHHMKFVLICPDDFFYLLHFTFIAKVALLMHNLGSFASKTRITKFTLVGFLTSVNIIVIF